MGLGAIEAIEAAGKVPGKDIKIVTVDAVKDGMQALSDGKINYIVECSPLLGPQLMDDHQEGQRAGETVQKRIVTEETTFTQEQAKAALPERDSTEPSATTTVRSTIRAGPGASHRLGAPTGAASRDRPVGEDRTDERRGSRSSR